MMEGTHTPARAALRAALRKVAALGSLAAALIAAGCAGGDRPPTETRPRVELRAPALDGGEIDVARYRGKPVVVHIFAPGEPDTARDVDELNAVHDDVSEAVVIGIALEPGGYNLLSAWRSGMGVDYLLGLVSDPEEIRTRHIEPLEALPTTLIIGADGRLAHRIDRRLQRGEVTRALADLGAGAPAQSRPPEPE